MQPKDPEIQTPALSEAREEKTETKNRLEKLKLAFENGQDVVLITNLLEQYLENTTVTDGKLPEEMTPEQMEAMTKILTPDQVKRIIDIVNKPNPGTATASAYPGIDRMKSVIEQGMNNSMIKPIIDKFSTLGLKKSFIVSGFLAALVSVLIKVPYAQGIAADIALNQAADSISDDKLLSPAQKAERMKARTTEEGRRNFMVAFDDWVTKGASANKRPGSAAFLAPSAAPTVTTQAPAVAVPEKAAVILGEKVEGTRSVKLIDTSEIVMTHGNDKTEVKTAGINAEMSVQGAKILDVYAQNAHGKEEGTVTLKLADNRTVLIAAISLQNAVSKKMTSLKTKDGFTIELTMKTA